MPIVYIHGVANRLDDEGRLPGWDDIKTLLRRYVAPTISSSPDSVSITFAYWGNFGATYYWSGDSRPRTKLLSQGTAQSDRDQQLREIGGLNALPAPSVELGVNSGLTSGQGASAKMQSTIRLRDLTNLELSDVLCSAIDKIENLPTGDAKIQADEIAANPEVRLRLEAAADISEELNILREELNARAPSATTLLAQGADHWWDRVVDRAREVMTRVDSSAGYAVSRLAVEFRGPINDAVTKFFGDVFAYLQQKGDRPGTIRGAVRDALLQAKQDTRDPQEPFIVLSHSMGGQIVFDLATQVLGDAGLRIDFWAAIASQVGLFEELKLLLASDVNIRGPRGRAAFPPNVGWWWNVWDSNDILSYTARPIFELAIDDEEWNSGASLAQAHGAYLRRPSFYRRFAEKLQTAKAQNFNRP